MISSLLPPTSFALKFRRIKISNAADMQTTEGQHNGGNSSCQDRSEVLARGYSVAPGKEKKKRSSRSKKEPVHGEKDILSYHIPAKHHAFKFPRQPMENLSKRVRTKLQLSSNTDSHDHLCTVSNAGFQFGTWRSVPDPRSHIRR